MDEYYLNPYSVRQVNLLVGYKSVQFEPKGMIVVNIAGRVDMIGDDGTLKLLLRSDDETDKLQLVIVVSTVHSLWFPLTKTSFSEALEQVMHKNVYRFSEKCLETNLRGFGTEVFREIYYGCDIVGEGEVISGDFNF